MGSVQNPKQYCFAISSITPHKVLTSWMHEASHWKCQCRILTARTSGHGKKMCRPWSQLAGNMTGHLALIRRNESHIGDYNLIFLVLFLWCELWSLLVSRGRPKYIYIYICIHLSNIPHISKSHQWNQKISEASYSDIGAPDWRSDSRGGEKLWKNWAAGADFLWKTMFNPRLI